MSRCIGAPRSAGAWILHFAAFFSCSRQVDERSGARPAHSTSAVRTASGAAQASSAPRAASERGPQKLLALSTSAYHADLASDDGAFYLLTHARAYRLWFEREPAPMTLDLGHGATATNTSFVFWSGGAVHAAPKGGGDSRRLTGLSARPQRFTTSGERVAWLERSDEGHFAVRALDDGRPHTVYSSPGTIDAIAMLGDWVYFVERPDGSSWRIGGVRATGAGATRFTGLRGGRAPAMLAARGDALHYYDGNRFEVRRLAADLARETMLARDLVCSPLAVFEHVYCANVEGIFELARGAPPRGLVRGAAGNPVTALAANARAIAWISDAGADKLEVRALELE